jgi:hypothetical protein
MLMKVTPVRLPPGRTRLATRPNSTGSAPLLKDDRDRRGCAFGREYRRAAGCRDYVDVTIDEVGGQSGQPIIATLRPAVFDRHVLALDVAGLAEPLAERRQTLCTRVGRPGAQVADHRHHLLLRARGQRPGNRRADGKSDELPPDHLITPSASDGGPAHHQVCSSHTATGSGLVGATFQLGAMFGVGRSGGIENTA